MLKKIVFVLALVSAYLPSAHAGFALVAPAANYVSSGATALVQAAANDVSFAGGIRAAGGIVNVAGTAVTVPAAYRFAANAPRVAAAFAFSNPALLVAGTAAAAYAYYLSGGFEIENGIWKKQTTVKEGQWCDQNTPKICAATPIQAANQHWANTPKTCNSSNYCTWLTFSNTMCDALDGTSSTHCTSVQTGHWSDATHPDVSGAPSNKGLSFNLFQVDVKKLVDTNSQEFSDVMAPKPLPANVPQQLPVPLPVEPLPILNPSAPPTPSNPATDPVPTPQPLRVPQALPQPIPGTNPQQYKQPVIDIVPANDSSSPWKVDLQPKDIVSTNPNPLTDPVANPTPSTDPAPFEMPCGVAGKSPCAVKVDETGMPSNPTAEGYTPKLDQLKVDQDGLRNQIATPADKPFFSGWSVLFSAPAVATCSPIVLPNGPSGVSMGSLDPCPVVDGVRYIMGLIWAATGMFFSLKMIREVI